MRNLAQGPPIPTPSIETYHANLGGGERQNQFWRPQKLGLVWSVPLSFKGNDRESPKDGVENVSQVGGSKDVLGEGFYGVFPPPPPSPLSFPPPLATL